MLQVRTVALTVGQTATFDFSVAVGAQQAVITVRCVTPQLDVTSFNLVSRYCT